MSSTDCTLNSQSGLQQTQQCCEEINIGWVNVEVQAFDKMTQLTFIHVKLSNHGEVKPSHSTNLLQTWIYGERGHPAESLHGWEEMIYLERMSELMSPPHFHQTLFMLRFLQVWHSSAWVSTEWSGYVRVRMDQVIPPSEVPLRRDRITEQAGRFV